ncbi:Polyisoprenyl-teichoic acid--peptidoglycan teichoic acid transferase TagU [Paenibacillus plantiphilus]|uniref:Polyisoprenyl-teichoic acid--peptidoglycan teichoic acid transferase TagU n=1 Tax=Paenibacillus plantiphilus TaxID=2905650 RepID=A0ABN8G688_9BACL|nr:LCP family protein [Paenibacillus plantiphilus]CAH1201313.1 Polyisoprenyl-teichoic acid--peptidoglycan teichoic acid transferase TagU [Paenibacillus plantiphilus]
MINSTNRKSRRWKWLIGIIAFVILVGSVGYYNRVALGMWGFDMFLADDVEKKLENSYKPLEGRNTQQIAYKKEAPFSMLLLGVDQRGKEVGRSDTMIYTVVRPTDGSVLMVSIPRDTYTEIVGKKSKAGNEFYDKITHAYAFGGAKMAVETVEKLFGHPLDHYASINFSGFREVIDAMDGVALPITEDLVNDDADHEKFVVKAGQEVYMGQDALNYVRFREDAGGDTSRTGRHQVFLNAIMNKAAQVEQWSNIPEFIEIMGENFNTDLTPEHMIDLAKSMLQAETRTIYSHTLKGNGHRKSDHGAWYYFADEEDLENVKDLIELWLDPTLTKAQLPIPEQFLKKQNTNKPADKSNKPSKPVHSLSSTTTNAVKATYGK